MKNFLSHPLFVNLFIHITLDVDECLDSPCSINATCQNTDGSHICKCNDGHDGNGVNCTGTFITVANQTIHFILNLSYWDNMTIPNVM